MRKKVVWGFIMVLFLATSGLLVYTTQRVEVDASQVGRGDIKKYTEDVGTVKCKGARSISIEGEGRIINLPYDLGERVKKGDLLLRLDAGQIELLLKDADEKIRTCQAQFENTEISYHSALTNYDNAVVLARGGAISQWDLQQKEDALKSTRTSLEAMKAQMEQANVSRANCLLNLKQQELFSPIDGIVLEKRVDLYSVASPGTVAFVIGDPGNIEIESDILADDAGNIRLGNDVEITVRSQDKPTITGQISKIAPSAVTVTSSLGVNEKRVTVTITPHKSSALLKPGYEVDVKIITNRKSGVITVPATAVFNYKGRNCVFVVENGRAVIRPVNKGMQDDSWVEIKSGLVEEEMVITEPDNTIREGIKVKV
jgi:HlyD family secretion protein